MRSFTRRAGLAIVATGLLTASCGTPKTTGATMSWTLAPQPPGVGPATLTVTLQDPGGTAVTGATLRIDGYMAHPGMAPVAAEAAERSPGVYVATVNFTMSGDWVLLVSATLADGARLEEQIDVRHVRS